MHLGPVATVAIPLSMLAVVSCGSSGGDSGGSSGTGGTSTDTSGNPTDTGSPGDDTSGDTAHQGQDDTAGDDTGNPGDDTGHNDTGGHDTGHHRYIKFDGTEEIQWGFAPMRDAINCDLSYTMTGSPVTTLCPGCDFVFDVSDTYDASSSTDNGRDPVGYCAALETDYTWTIAYAKDYHGYGPYALFYYGGGAYYGAGYYAFAPATFDPGSGKFTYTNEVSNYYYPGDGYYPQYRGYYENYYDYGYAIVK